AIHGLGFRVHKGKRQTGGRRTYFDRFLSQGRHCAPHDDRRSCQTKNFLETHGILLPKCSDKFSIRNAGRETTFDKVKFVVTSVHGAASQLRPPWKLALFLNARSLDAVASNLRSFRSRSAKTSGMNQAFPRQVGTNCGARKSKLLSLFGTPSIFCATLKPS